MIRKFLILTIISIVFFSCKKEEIIVPPVEYKANAFLKESKELNNQILQYEEKLIKQYIKQSGEDFKPNTFGIWLNNGAEKSSSMANEGDKVDYTFQVHSLAGDLIYSFEEVGNKKIHLGEQGIQRGLHSALQYIEPNSTAKVIMPSGLAFGFKGDGNKIQPNEPLVYEIKVLKIKKAS